MTITITVTKTTSGWPLHSSSIVRQPWNDSPEYLVAVEQVPPIVLSRVNTSTVALAWLPGPAGSARADVHITTQVRGNVPIDHLLISWGDGGTDVVPAYGLSNLTVRSTHFFLIASTLITIRAYDSLNVLVDTGSESISLVLSTNYLIHQYRIEKYKGSDNYHIYNGRWLQDWVTYSGAASQTNFNDYAAPSGWNWGYRLWLREVDDQGRPGLMTLPSAWAKTGTGEGS